MKLVYMIINYNDADTVNELISQIKDYHAIDEILVVDNHSTDRSIQKLRKIKNKKVRIIETSENRGYGSAINYGTNDVLKRYLDAYLVISNADIVVSSEKDIITLTKELEENNVGMTAPTIIEHGTKNRGWKLPSPMQDVLENIVYFGRKFQKRRLYPESHYKGRKSVVDVLSGCVFFMKASTVKDAGYFDENVFLYYEENIMAVKLKQIHLKSVIYNDISFLHNHSVSIDKSVKRLNKYKILKKSQAYFEKNYNHANCLEQFLLWLTNWCSYVVLTVVYWIQDLGK